MTLFLQAIIDIDLNDPLMIKQQLDITTTFTEVIQLDSPKFHKSLQRVKLFSQSHWCIDF